MWSREIDMPSGNLYVKDVLDILVCVLTREEMKELAGELCRQLRGCA